MYTNQQVRVLRNGVYSNVFSVVSGVKQGGVISPVLFCLYMDELFVRLREAGVGSYVSCWFVGALAYADDLFAPSATAMRHLLSVCNSFASEYNMLFNPKKAKCLIFRPMTSRSGINSVLPTFTIEGSGIENVNRWPHLGHISTNLNDQADILYRNYMPTIQYSARSAWLCVRPCKLACPKIISGQSNLP